MIPKIIHYCWFGGNPLPELVQNCIKSWRKCCPDYEIVEWNERNFDVHCNRFVSEAYQAKKWAFVADYARLQAIYSCGGIYLDSDVELLRPLDIFLSDRAFAGFETKDSPAAIVLGCEKEHPLIKEFMDYYESRPFIREDGSYDMRTNTSIFTELVVQHGLRLTGKKQAVADCVIYPEIVFSPNNFRRIFYLYSSKSYSVHHILGSWGVTPTYERKFHKRVLMYCVRVARDLIGTPRVGKIIAMIRGR